MKIDTIDIIMLILILIYCIYIIIYEKRSIRSKLIEKTVSLSNYKTIISNEEVYDKYITKMMKKEEEPYCLPKYKFKCSIEKQTHMGMDYYIINKNDNHKKIFYLHGGSYIENPLIFHIKFLDDLANESNLEIILPIYPKAPKYNYTIGYEKVFGLYNFLFNDKNKVIIMGDSAGGGFSLGLSMMLKENNKTKPTDIILLSPWLDITMKNDDIKKYEKKDPFLSKKALIKAGLLWSGNSDPNHYLLSPINGCFKGIGKITLFVGTHEILLPDIRKFKNILDNNSISYNYFEYKKMNHVFPLHPIPEAKDAKKQILDIINKVL